MVGEITVVSPKELMILANDLIDFYVSERLVCVGSSRIIYFFLFNDVPVGNWKVHRLEWYGD
jgi:hypothetical protein